MLGEQAAGERAGRGGGAVDRAPDAERDAPVTAVVGDVEQGGGAREHGRAAEALEDPGSDQGLLVRGDRAEQRGDREDDDADQVGAAAAEPVGERAGAEDQGGQGQGVPVDDPLEVGVARPGSRRRSPAGRRRQ